jgi:hypothetical protein
MWMRTWSIMLGRNQEGESDIFGDRDGDKLDFCITFLWSVLKSSLRWTTQHDAHFIWEECGWGALVSECLSHIGWVMTWLNHYNEDPNNERSWQRQDNLFQELNKGNEESTKGTVDRQLRWVKMQIEWNGWCSPTYGMGHGIGREFSRFIWMVMKWLRDPRIVGWSWHRNWLEHVLTWKYLGSFFLGIPISLPWFPLKVYFLYLEKAYCL